MTWINGEEFQEVITYIDCGIVEANKTQEIMHQVQKYVNNKTEEANKLQDNILKFEKKLKVLSETLGNC